MKNQSPSRWILIGLMALVAVLLIVVIVQLNKLNDRPDNSDVVTTTESFEPTPSVAEPETVEAVVEEPTPEPVLEPQKLTISLDQKWFRVQGPVKTIKETTTYLNNGAYSDPETETYSFDEKGTFSAMKFKLTRNNAGQITRMQKTERDEYGRYTYSYNYTYNADGFVSKEIYKIGGDAEPTTRTTSYVLDDKGWIVTSVAKEWEGGWNTYTSTYTYSDIDEHGNWHKADIKTVASYEVDGSSEVYKSRITRQITYWK